MEGCEGVLPNRDGLKRKRVDVPSSCVVCVAVPKDSRYLFLGCWFVQLCWQHAGLATVVYGAMKNVAYFEEWLFYILRSVYGRNERNGSDVQVCSKWHPPQGLALNCNVDAATFAERGYFGARMVVQDGTGPVLAYSINVVQGCPGPTECEALALLEAMKWVCSLGYSRI